jgi:hypothetical protein
LPTVPLAATFKRLDEARAANAGCGPTGITFERPCEVVLRRAEALRPRSCRSISAVDKGCRTPARADDGTSMRAGLGTVSDKPRGRKARPTSQRWSKATALWRFDAARRWRCIWYALRGGCPAMRTVGTDATRASSTCPSMSGAACRLARFHTAAERQRVALDVQTDHLTAAHGGARIELLGACSITSRRIDRALVRETNPAGMVSDWFWSCL